MGGDEELAWIVASHSADFFARFAPTADADRLLVAALWVYWGFGFDDARCDNGPLSADPGAFAALAGRVQRAVEPPSAAAASEPYIPALKDIVGRFRAFGGPAQLRRRGGGTRAC